MTTKRDTSATAVPADSGIAARVLERTFLGAVEQLQLAVDGIAEPLRIQVFDHGAARPADMIHLRVLAGAALVFAADTDPPRSER